MARFFILTLLFIGTNVYSQCSIEITDTVHVNCNGAYTGAVYMNIQAANPYTLSLSNGAISIDGSSFEGLLAENYEIIIVDANQCSDTVSIKIKEPPVLEVDLLCENSQLIATVTGGVSNYDYLWKDRNSTIISYDSVVVYEPKNLYDFKLTDSKGCVFTDTVEVVADFSVNDTLGEMPFEVLLNDQSVNSVLFEWDFGDGESSTLSSPSHSYQEVGSFDLSLTISDQHQCQDYKTITIEVQGFEMEPNNWEGMFNAFSPNGDGINDDFSFLDNNAISSFQVNIYNRWGNLVFSWNDPKQKWNGQSKSGKKLKQGVYFYDLKAQGQNGKNYEKKGVVSLF